MIPIALPGILNQQGGTSPVSGLLYDWDASDTGSITGTTDVTAFADQVSATTLTQPGGFGPASGTRTIGGLNVLDFVSANLDALRNGPAQDLTLNSFVLISVFVKDDTATDTVFGRRTSALSTGQYALSCTSTVLNGIFHDGTDRTISGSATTTTAGVALLAVNRQTSDQTMTLRWNGTEVASSSWTATPTSLTGNSANHLNISNINGPGQNFDGGIAECIMYLRAADFTTTQLEYLEDQLTTKWSL